MIQHHVDPAALLGRGGRECGCAVGWTITRKYMAVWITAPPYSPSLVHSAECNDFLPEIYHDKKK